MSQTVVINGKGKFADGMTPGTQKALRSLERLERRIDRVIRHSRQLSGVNVQVKIDAIDLASKKIRKVMAMGARLNHMVFQPKITMKSTKEKLVDPGSIKGNKAKKAGAKKEIRKEEKGSTKKETKGKLQQWAEGFAGDVKESLQMQAMNDSISKYKENFLEIGGDIKERFKRTKIGEFAVRKVDKVKNSKAGELAAAGVEKIKSVPGKLVDSRAMQAVREKANVALDNPMGRKIKNIFSRTGNAIGKNAPGVLDYVSSAVNIVKAKNKGKAIFKEGGGLLGGAAGGAAGAAAGAKVGTLAGGPVGTVVGAGVGFVGGIIGSNKGEEIGEKVYNVVSKAGEKLKNGFKKLSSFKLPKIKVKKPKNYSLSQTKWNGSDSMYYNGMKGSTYSYQKHLQEKKEKDLKKKKTISKEKKTDPSENRTAKKVTKQVKDVGSNSKKAGTKIQNLGKISGGSQKQVAGLGVNSVSAGTFIAGMGSSASGAAGVFGMLSGAAAMAAARLAALPFISFGAMALGSRVQKNANGSFVGGKTLSWIGEDGPEVIIPLGGKRRKRGLDLWHQAGAMLGVSQHAEGGFVGSGTPVGKRSSGGKKTMPINVSVGNITIELRGSHDEAGNNIDLLKLLREQKNRVSDEICTILADALEAAYHNIPVAQ